MYLYLYLFYVFNVYLFSIYSCLMEIRAKFGNHALILAFVLYICFCEFENFQYIS